jgi:hypothetical protein
MADWREQALEFVNQYDTAKNDAEREYIVFALADEADLAVIEALVQEIITLRNLLDNATAD